VTPAPVGELWWTAAVGVVTLAWVLIAVAGGDASPVATTTLGAAAAAATAALVGVGWTASSVETAQVAGPVLAVVPLGVAAAAGGSALLLGAATVVLAVGELATRLRGRGRHHRPPALAAAAGAALVAVGIVLARLDSLDGGWRLPATDDLAAGLALAGAALLVATATLGPPHLRPLVVAGALVGLTAAPAFSTVAVAAGAAGLAAAWAVAAGQRPTPSVVALAVGVATAVPSARPAALLLIAGGALAAGVEHRASALVALPGAAAVAAALVAASPTTEVKVLAAAAAMTVLAIAAAPSDPVRPSVPTPALGLAALGLWLVAAPTTWGWVGDGPADLATYQRGVAVAAAGAALAVVVHRLSPRRRAPAPPG